MEMLINLLIHNVQILALVINWLKPVSRLQKTVVCSLFEVWSGLLTSGDKADWLWLQLKPFGIKKPDQTGLSNTNHM